MLGLSSDSLLDPCRADRCDRRRVTVLTRAMRRRQSGCRKETRGEVQSQGCSDTTRQHGAGIANAFWSQVNLVEANAEIGAELLPLVWRVTMNAPQAEKPGAAGFLSPQDSGRSRWLRRCAGAMLLLSDAAAVASTPPPRPADSRARRSRDRSRLRARPRRERDQGRGRAPRRRRSRCCDSVRRNRTEG